MRQRQRTCCCARCATMMRARLCCWRVRPPEAHDTSIPSSDLRSSEVSVQKWTPPFDSQAKLHAPCWQGTQTRLGRVASAELARPALVQRRKPQRRWRHLHISRRPRLRQLAAVLLGEQFPVPAVDRRSAISTWGTRMCPHNPHRQSTFPNDGIAPETLPGARVEARCDGWLGPRQRWR